MKFSNGLLQAWPSAFFNVKEIVFRAFRSAEVQKFARDFLHGLDFSLSLEKSYSISDEHDYHERYNEVDYQDYGQNNLVSYSGYEDFSEKQDYETNNFFQTQYEDLSQKQDNQAFAIDVSTAQTYPSIIL